MINTLLQFSSKNEGKVFNHGVLASKEKSPPSLSHRGLKVSKLFHQKSPMLIHGDNTPNLGVVMSHIRALSPMTKLKNLPDFEASRARGALLYSYDSQELQSSASFWNLSTGYSLKDEKQSQIRQTKHRNGKNEKIRVQRCLHLLLGQPDTIYMGRTDSYLLKPK
ncbi:hypothetical protein Tco_0850210 [Tanacetum coccineum]